MESSQDEDSEPIPTVYVKQRRGSFLSQPGKVQTLIQNLEEHYAQEWEKKAKTKQQNKKPQGKKVTIPKNHSDKSVEEPRQELIKELKHHHKESSSMPSVVMSNELTPTTARKKTAAASHQFRGKAGTFLLQTQKEGFMNVKRNGTSRWRRLWVALTDTSLFCYRDITYSTNETLPKFVIPLNLAAVKRIPSKSTKFLIITSGEKYYFNTENEKENVNDWLNSIQTICDKLILNSIVTSPTKDSAPLSKENQNPASEYLESTKAVSSDENLTALNFGSNQVCADCGAPDPEWASVNLGTLICLQCSGVHRSFGTHISQVRSLTLDKWNPEQITLMKEMGNKKVNEIWEFNLPENVSRITPSSSRKERETYLYDKYVTGKFRQDYVPKDNVNIESLLTPALLKETFLEELRNDAEFCFELHKLLFDI